MNLSAAADGSNDEGIVARYPSTNAGWILGRWRDGKLFFGLDTNGTWSPERTAASSAALALNTWVHVAATYDHATGQARVYVDGGLSGTADGPPLTITSSASRVSIGA